MDFTYNPNQIALLGEDDKLLAEVTFPEIDKEMCIRDRSVSG